MSKDDGFQSLKSSILHYINARSPYLRHFIGSVISGNSTFNFFSGACHNSLALGNLLVYICIFQALVATTSVFLPAVFKCSPYVCLDGQNIRFESQCCISRFLSSNAVVYFS
jgi:hypothetical protein